MKGFRLEVNCTDDHGTETELLFIYSSFTTHGFRGAGRGVPVEISTRRELSLAEVRRGISRVSHRILGFLESVRFTARWATRWRR
mgnify:CR=1 FL=1